MQKEAVVQPVLIHHLKKSKFALFWSGSRPAQVCRWVPACPQVSWSRSWMRRRKGSTRSQRPRKETPQSHPSIHPLRLLNHPRNPPPQGRTSAMAQEQPLPRPGHGASPRSTGIQNLGAPRAAIASLALPAGNPSKLFYSLTESQDSSACVWCDVP